MENWPHGMNLVKDHMPSKGRVCIDCGANVGKWTRPLAEIFDKVIAIEPDLRAFQRNKKRLPKNAVLVNAAVGAVAGKAKFSKMQKMECSHLGESKKAKEVVDIKVVTLDQYMDMNVDLIKIDVEGSEVDVLRGGLNLINAKKPILIIETHNTQAKVRDFIAKNLNYTIHEYGEAPRFQFACISN